MVTEFIVGLDEHTQNLFYLPNKYKIEIFICSFQPHILVILKKLLHIFANKHHDTKSNTTKVKQTKHSTFLKRKAFKDGSGYHMVLKL